MAEAPPALPISEIPSRRRASLERPKEAAQQPEQQQQQQKDEDDVPIFASHGRAAVIGMAVAPEPLSEMPPRRPSLEGRRMSLEMERRPSLEGKRRSLDQAQVDEIALEHRRSSLDGAGEPPAASSFSEPAAVKSEVVVERRHSRRGSFPLANIPLVVAEQNAAASSVETPTVATHPPPPTTSSSSLPPTTSAPILAAYVGIALVVSLFSGLIRTASLQNKKLPFVAPSEVLGPLSMALPLLALAMLHAYFSPR